MAEAVTYMKAPKGTSGATIEGHEYEVLKDGIIKVKNPNHPETLKRHGFVECDAPDAGEPDWSKMSDKAMVEYIEEHGGEADVSMSDKKLLKLAKKAYADSQED